MIVKKRYSLIAYSTNLFKIKAVIGSREKGDFQRINLLVDTGSSFTLISRQILIDLDYNIAQSIKKQQLITGKGVTSPIPVITVSWFNCAGKVINQFDVLAYDIPQSLKVDGILGMNFLVTEGAIISLDTKEIYFDS
jgi:aspartyl protease family protein